MTLLDTQSDAGRLAMALRAGDDDTAAALAAHLRLPPRLLTHRGLGPRASVPLEDAADALALTAALVASSSRGNAVDVAAEAQRHRLADPEVLDLVADEVEAAAVPGQPAAHPWAAAVEALDVLQEPAYRASVLLLRARTAEGAGAADEARTLVEHCLALAPGLRPAVRDAAEYEMCAGHWARAWELADSIGTDPVAEPMLPSLDALRRPAAGAGKVGRNRPCPCGSGRKYKVCCLHADERAAPHPLAERAVALYAMIATYAQRSPRRLVLDRMMACAIGAPQAGMLALDFAVFDGGAARQFLADRGHLLRPDERDLLTRWLTVPADLYEVTWVRPGSQLRARSLVGGAPSVELHDRMLSLSVTRLDLIVARFLPDGTRLRALGGLAGLGRDHRRQALAAFPSGPVLPGHGEQFPERLLALFSRPAPRRFVTGDGDEYRFCEATVVVADPPSAWAALRDRCLPPPRRLIRDVAGFRAYLESVPDRWWSQTAEDEVEYVGKVEPGTLTNLGTIEWRVAGKFRLTAYSEERLAALEAEIAAVAAGAVVTERTARTAEQLLEETREPDFDLDGGAAEPDSGAAERRRRGVNLPEAEPVTVILEQYFLPLEADQDHLAGQVSRAHAVERMLAARDEDGLTPAEAVAAGGAPLERVRALLDDCEWRLQRKLEAGEEADLLPDPAELRRRVGLPPR
jgi:SEC-C motif